MIARRHGVVVCSLMHVEELVELVGIIWIDQSTPAQDKHTCCTIIEILVL